MYKLVLIRHGQSVWNKENRFTGWKDVPLSEQGLKEAKEAGKLLKENGFRFDVAYTSYLKRAIKTLWLALEEMDQMWIPVHRSWRLNERHYGDLEGLNKAETAKKFGDEQVHIWRRSYDTPPPQMKLDDPRYSGNFEMYEGIDKADIPLSECLKDTVERILPYWNDEICPAIKSGKKIIIAAHGNSLRAIVKLLDGLSDEEILKINIPTGIPLVYELDENFQGLRSEYLGQDPEDIKKAQEAVAKQGKA